MYVFNFTGPVTFNISGPTTVALPALSVDAPAALGPTVGVGSGSASPATSHSEPDPDADDKAKLRELLSDTQYRFRKLSTLADAIDRGHDETIDLLESIGARTEESNDELYGLISRVGD